MALFPHIPADLKHPRHWASWLGVGILRLLGWLPYPVLYAISAVLGELLFWLAKKRRHITLTNLGLCLGDLSDAERRKLARRHFRILVLSLLGIGVIWWGSKARLRRIISIRGMHHLSSFTDTKKPVILLAPHFVTLDAGGMALSKEGALLSMYQVNKNPVFDWITFQRRTRFGADIYSRKAPLTSLIRKIRSGTPFYYLPDQNAGAKHGMFVPFFGIPASTFPFLGKIAQSGKATVVPVFSRTLPWGRGIEVLIEPPLEGFPTGDEFADTLRMNQEIEKGVLRLKENYLWSHKRFKRRPDGEPDLYRQA